MNLTLRIALCLAILSFAGAGSLAQPNNVNDNLVIVLDASGSMDDRMAGGQQKMLAAKDALKQVLHNLPPGINVGLLVLPRGDWVYPLGPRDDSKLVPAIDSIEAGGGTPLGEYLKIGTDRLLQARAQNLGYGNYRLLVITDGEATDGSLTDEYVPDILSRGIRLDAIGVAMEQRHTLATKVHSYRNADDPQTLLQAVREVVAEVSKPSDDLSDTAFDLITGLPDELAPKIIDALSSSGNQPIGEEPPAPAQVSSQTPGQETLATEDEKPTIIFIAIIGGVMMVLLALMALLKDRRFDDY